LAGRPFLDLIPAEQRTIVEVALRSTAQAGTSQTLKLQLESLSDEPRWYNLTASAVHIEDAISALLVQLYDISEQVQAEQHEQELQIAHERSETLENAIADLSHDLKTPLTTINTTLYLLQRELDPEGKNPRFSQIGQQVTNLSHLINDLLTISRLERIGEVLFEPVSTQELVAQIETHITLLAEQKGVKFQIEQQTNCAISGIEQELVRALRNLLENAVHYTPEGGSVWLRLFDGQKMVLIEVQDTGIGISSEDMERIFERYFRTQQSSNLRTGGSGLGLAIVKKIVDLHQGQIEVQSAQNKGTTFRVYLPRPEDMIASA